jgi:UV excision repair protein RAD23
LKQLVTSYNLLYDDPLLGQQNPELLRLINAHQEDFLALMNEPIDENDEGENDEDQYDGFAHLLLPLLISSRTDDEGDHDLAELLHMFPTLSEEEQQAAAQGLGMPLEQVQQLAQMLGTLPPDQIQQMLGAHFGGGEADGDEQPGGHVVALTQEEMNSVNRLMELGFSQQDAAAAFLACDRNEALAANLLLEGWSAEDIAHY